MRFIRMKKCDRALFKTPNVITPTKIDKFSYISTIPS